jgi:hypothetical protein
MREEFLHYVWYNKKFDFSNAKTVCNKEITVIDSGKYTKGTGADFFNAQLIIDDLRWAGNVEIHLNSSDWYLHNHHNDSNYNNVILHVVWNHDVDVYYRDQTVLPVLELKNYVAETLKSEYMNFNFSKSWIFCENQIQHINRTILEKWKEELFFQRLQEKAFPMKTLLDASQNDWEAVLFCMLAKNFGLNINGSVFFELAKSIPFSIIRKEAYEVENLEALFLGRAGLLENDFQDTYPKELQNRWNYLKVKYNIADVRIEQVEFFKHRPDNFPTIRLAQLAMLYHKNQYLFETLIQSVSLEDFYSLFELGISSYWNTHYVLDKESPKKRKLLSKSFIDLLVINTVIPMKYLYQHYQQKIDYQQLLQPLQAVKPEQNIIIDRFKQIGISSNNAFDTQALLQLKKHYCDHKKCMNCSIGLSLLQ